MRAGVRNRRGFFSISFNIWKHRVATYHRSVVPRAMTFDDCTFRPITFQGVIFPATLMGISILEPVLDIKDGDVAGWLCRLSASSGVTKSAPAERCARCARQVADLMLEQRQRVLDGIRERLASHGFDAEDTYRDWLLALQRIAELSTTARDDCFWSAPLQADDRNKTRADAKNSLNTLDRARSDLPETGNI